MAKDWYEEPWAIPVFVVFGYTLYKVFTEKPLQPTTAPEPVTSSAPVPAQTFYQHDALPDSGPHTQPYAPYVPPRFPEPAPAAQGLGYMPQKPFNRPSGATAANPYGEMCIPEAATVSIPPCPEGQERNPGPCSWPGGPRWAQSIWARGNFCPTGFKPNRGAIKCREKCTGKPPDSWIQRHQVQDNLVKSEYRIGPDEPANKLPRCVPVGTNVVVDPCPPGQHRACHRMAWKCPEGQKMVAASSCGKCSAPVDPNRRVPYGEERRKKSCLQSRYGAWNSATRKCELRKVTRFASERR